MKHIEQGISNVSYEMNERSINEIKYGNRAGEKQERDGGEAL